MGQWVPGAFGDDGQYKIDTNRRPKPPQGSNRNRAPNGISGPRPEGSVDTPVYVPNRPNPTPGRGNAAPVAALNSKIKPIETVKSFEKGNPNFNFQSNKKTTYTAEQKPDVYRPNPTPNINYQNIPNIQNNRNTEDNTYSTGQINLSNYQTAAAGQCGVRRVGLNSYI